MAEFPALPLWTDAYIADTQHLTNEEHGVYLRLLMFAWRSPDNSLPDDPMRLATMVGMTMFKWRRVDDSRWSLTLHRGEPVRNGRITAEIEITE